VASQSVYEDGAEEGVFVDKEDVHGAKGSFLFFKARYHESISDIQALIVRKRKTATLAPMRRDGIWQTCNLAACLTRPIAQPFTQPDEASGLHHTPIRLARVQIRNIQPYPPSLNYQIALNKPLIPHFAIIRLPPETDFNL
jgi:hypothetical protein